MSIKERKVRTAKQKKETTLDFEVIKKSSLILRALNHKVRQQILLFIDKKGETTVSDIYSKLRIEQSVTSQHLAVLRKAGFVITRREGQRIYYSVNYKRLTNVQGHSEGIAFS